ncbi:MAG: hypothetical protein RL701_3907 [Pseudomonadota bacterium]
MNPLFDSARMTQQLAQGELPDRPTLDASWRCPDEFHRALLEEASRCFGTSKSRYGECYDFYHDLISRHLNEPADALCYLDRHSRLHKLSYTALDALATRLCASLHVQGVVAGDTVAIVQPVGPFYAAALLACLRIGAAVSCIEPRGRSFVRDRLARFEPQHILADAQHAWYVAPATPLDTSALSELSVPDRGSHSYAAADPVLRTLSALQEEPTEPSELDANTCYLGLARDSVLVWPIRRGERVAAPSFDAEQYQPYLLLATWFAGGCFAVCEQADLAADTGLLDRIDPHLLGVQAATLERVLSAAPPLRLSALRRWFCSPLAELALAQLERFQASRAHTAAASFCVVTSAAHGGALLCSAKAARLTLPRLTPIPGLSWQLTAANLTGMPAVFDTGLLAVGASNADAATSGNLLLSGFEGAYVLAGAVTPLRHGRAYPTRLVAEVIETHPAVDHAAVFATRDPAGLHAGLAIALIFVNPADPKAVRMRSAVWLKQIEELVARELGHELVPDRLRIYPLAPALVDNKADVRFCQTQYLDGILDAKATTRSFNALAALRRLFATVPPAP